MRSETTAYEYFDTSVFIASMRPQEMAKHIISQNLILDVVMGKTTLILSKWAILEVIDALKRVTARKSKLSVPIHIVEQDIQNFINNFLNFVTSMADLGNIIIAKHDESIDDYYGYIYDKIIHQKIKVTVSNRQYKVSGMGYRDIAHLYHAKKSSVKKFRTWDRGFAEAAGDSDYAKMQIIILQDSQAPAP